MRSKIIEDYVEKLKEIYEPPITFALLEISYFEDIFIQEYTIIKTYVVSGL